VVFLLAYAFAVWSLAFAYRRRWPAFAAVALALPPIAGAVHLDVLFVERVVEEDADWRYALAGAFAALIVGVGLLIAVQPRSAPSYACRVCHYDLRGISPALCPECGAELVGDQPRRPPIAHEQAPSQPQTFSLNTQSASSRRHLSQRSARFSAVTTIAPPTAQAASQSHAPPETPSSRAPDSASSAG